ncbi:MAG: carbohydrate kinase family protein [Anaerolineales bacterium]
MNETAEPHGPVVVIGASGMDVIGKLAGPLSVGTSNPGRLRMSSGGVARNVAENLARLGIETELVTAVGEDSNGRHLLDQAVEVGIGVEYCVRVPGGRTGAYLALLDEHGGLHAGLDDMRVIEGLTPEHLRTVEPVIAEASAVFLDANLSPASLSTAIALASAHGVRVAADPTSRTLAPRLVPHLANLWLITPNEAEAGVLCPKPIVHAQVNQAIEVARQLVASGVHIAVLALAEFGVAYASAEESGHVPALRTEIADPTGAGDAMTAALIFALLNNIPLDESVRLGASAAALTLRAHGTVAPGLSLELLYDQLR